MIVWVGVVDKESAAAELVGGAHQKALSVLAANTAAHITWTPSNPSVQAGETLYARAAAAAVFAALSTPTTAIIPFIEAGTGTDSAYCSGMINALDDAR